MSRSSGTLAVLIVVAISSLFIFWHVKRPVYETERENLSSALRGLPSLEVFFLDHLYTIEDGVITSGTPGSFLEEIIVLRTAWYSAKARWDPVFALPGTDPELLWNSVESLVGVRDQFLSLPISSEASELFRDLYPVEFLFSLASAERSRNTFLSHPDMASAARYHFSLKRVSRLYLGSISRRIEEMMYFEPRRAVYPTGTSSNSFLRGKFEDLLRSARVSASLVDDDYSCFRSFSESCASSVIEKVIAGQSGFRANAAERQMVLGGTVRSNYTILKSYYSSNPFFRRSYMVPVVGNSRCLPSTSKLSVPISYFVWWGSIAEGDFFYADVSDELFFKAREALPSLARDRYAKDDIHAAYQPITTPYMCPDVGYDLTAIRTGIAIRDSLARDPVSIERSSSISQRDGLIDVGTLSLYDVDEHLGLLTERLKRGVYLSPEGGAGDTQRVLDLLVLKRAQSSAYDEIIRLVTYFSKHHLGEILKSGEREGSEHARRFFTFYTNPTILFLTANKTFVDSEISFVDSSKGGNNILQTAEGHLSTRSTRFPGYSDEEILVEMRRERDLKYEILDLERLVVGGLPTVRLR